jgi:hypothetical protein
MHRQNEARKVRFDPAARVSRNLPVEYYILTNVELRGAVIGYVTGRPIRETAVDAGGLRYRFAGIAPRDADGRYDVLSLGDGEWIVEPGLIYAADQPA